MNAYELADDAKNISNTIEALEYVQKAVPMLRQQADRIAELEKQLYFKDYYEELPDTPVGLQTTPQTKLLSDEEIHELANKHLRTQDHDGAKVVLGLEDFARAIEAKVRGEK